MQEEEEEDDWERVDGMRVEERRRVRGVKERMTCDVPEQGIGGL